MAALPPQPPGNMPPEPPVLVPAGGPPPVGPPQGPYSPGNAYSGQMPYTPQAMPQPVVVKVHKRTFWLTIAQIIIIVKGILVLLLAAGSIAVGVYILAAGHDALRNIPGYDNYANQFGNAFLNAAGALFFAFAVVPLIIGIVDIILGIVVRTAIAGRTLDHRRARRDQHPHCDRGFRPCELQHGRSDSRCVSRAAADRAVRDAARSGDAKKFRG